MKIRFLILPLSLVLLTIGYFGIQTPGLSLYQEYAHQGIPNLLKPNYVKKTQVVHSDEWGKPQPVSETIVATKDGQTLEPSRKVTIETEVQGDITGLSFNTQSLSSDTQGYAFFMEKNQSFCISYRAYYLVESGTREYCNGKTGQVISSNAYTIKIPQHGEYATMPANTQP